jgi:hypothetical protein
VTALRQLARERSPLLVFPAVVLLVAAVLVLLNLNGSSVGILGVNYKKDPALVAGTPRIIRSDEAALSTTSFVGNYRRGMPVTPWIGLTETFLPATSVGAASDHWTEVFKPQDWGLWVFGVSRGFAWHWWSQVVVGLLGMFALLYALTRRKWTSAGLAVVACFSPYVAWWSLTPGLVLGYMAGAAAMALAAYRASSTGRAVAWSVAGGYLATAALLFLYPPWQITLGWVLLALLVGAAIDQRVPLRRLATIAVSAGVVVAVTGGAWYLQSRDALIATANTIYPGQRLAEAGQGNVAWLFDQPSSPFVAAAPARALRGATLAANNDILFANQSEVASAWLPLPLLLLLVAALVFAFVRARREPPITELSEAARGDEAAQVNEVATGQSVPLLWTTVGVAAAGLLLLAWAVVPLPSWTGKITLLDRVPGVRTSLALGLVAVLLVAIGSVVLRDVKWSRRWQALWAVAALATVWLSVWASNALPWGADGSPQFAPLLIDAAFFAVAFTLVASGKVVRTALVALVVASIATFVVVNPWYRGLGPLVTDPVVRAMEPLAAGPTPARVAVYGNATLDALVQSSGVVTLSGLTVYPDANVWKTLAPDQEEDWNNYSKYAWVADASVNPALIISASTTQRILRINPCAPQTLALKMDWAVSGTPLSFPCLRLYDQIKRGASYVYRYKVVSS